MDVKNPANESVNLLVVPTADGGGMIATSGKMTAFAATILSGASLSAAIDLGGLRAGAIIMPAAWTAASITFLVSHDGTTYSSLYDENDTEVAIATANVVSGHCRALPLSLFLLYRYVKLRSGTLALAVNQGADRALYVLAG